MAYLREWLSNRRFCPDKAANSIRAMHLKRRRSSHHRTRIEDEGDITPLTIAAEVQPMTFIPATLFLFSILGTLLARSDTHMNGRFVLQCVRNWKKLYFAFASQAVVQFRWFAVLSQLLEEGPRPIDRLRPRPAPTCEWEW